MLRNTTRFSVQLESHMGLLLRLFVWGTCRGCVPLFPLRGFSHLSPAGRRKRPLNTQAQALGAATKKRPLGSHAQRSWTLVFSWPLHLPPDALPWGVGEPSEVVVRTVHGSVARSVGRWIRHSLESTHWNGVLSVSLGPVRNGDDWLEVPVMHLFPCPVCLDLQHQEQICPTSNPDGLRGVVGLYLNGLPLRSDRWTISSESLLLGKNRAVA